MVAAKVVGPLRSIGWRKPWRSCLDFDRAMLSKQLCTEPTHRFGQAVRTLRGPPSPLDGEHLGRTLGKQRLFHAQRA